MAATKNIARSRGTIVSQESSGAEGVTVGEGVGVRVGDKVEDGEGDAVASTVINIGSGASPPSSPKELATSHAIVNCPAEDSTNVKFEAFAPSTFTLSTYHDNYTVVFRR